MAIMKKLLILLLFIPYLGFSQIKISALTEATTLNANDWFMAVQGGTTKKVAFYRFSYNQDSTALQITDSLAFYVQKTELSDSLLNYILRTELNDSLANYTSLDSLTYYMKTIDVRNAISDSIAGISSVSLGTANKVAFVNSTGTDLAYSDNFKWNDTTLTLNYGTANVLIGGNIGNSIQSGATYNTFLGGDDCASSITTGDNNVFIGANSGGVNTTGSYNVFIGSGAGEKSVDEVGNVFIGYLSGSNDTTSNKLYIENSSSSTPLIWGDFANDTIRINGTLDVTGDIVGGGEIKRRIYEAAAYVPEDSTLTTSATTAWQFLGIGANNKFVNIYAEGFSLDGDTLQWTQDPTDLRDSVEFNIGWSTSSSCSNNDILVSYGINIKNDSEPTYTIYNPVTRSTRCATSGQAYSWSCTTMPIFLKDGAKIQIVIKASGATTVTTEDFGIYLKEE